MAGIAPLSEWWPLAGLGALGAIGLFLAIRDRRRGAEQNRTDRQPAGWPFGGALWRGWVRLGPVSAAYCLYIAVAFGLPVFIGVSEPATRLWKLYAVLAIVGFIVATSLMLTIVLFNWPKKLVSPAMRAEPGAVREWRDARNGNRRQGNT